MLFALSAASALPFRMLAADENLPIILPKESINPEKLAASLMDKLIARASEFFDLQRIEPWHLFFFLGSIIVAVLAARASRWLVEVKLHKIASLSKNKSYDLVCLLLGKPVSLLVFAAGLYIGAIPMMSALSNHVTIFFDKFCLALAACAVSWALYRMVDLLEQVVKQFFSEHGGGLNEMLIPILRKSLRIMLVIVSVIFIGQNILDINVTALLAGAGVVGLAISFGAQNTVANFFSSLMIAMDQPFKIGERIITDKYDGFVENIGFRSTKLRTLGGNLITIPNNIIANTSIENVSRRPAIIFSADLALTYDTSPEKMREALAILKEIFSRHEFMKKEIPPRIYFDKMKDWSLNISVKAWYHSDDYWAFMDWQEKQYLEIMERFSAAGIDFAFPTNTTYLHRNPLKDSGSEAVIQRK